MTAKNPKKVDKPGPEAVGAIIKRYRKRDRQYTFGLRVRAYGERFWVPLGTEREGWNDVRAADTRNEIAALARRGVWRPPNDFALDPREKKPRLPRVLERLAEALPADGEATLSRDRRELAEPPCPAFPP